MVPVGFPNEQLSGGVRQSKALVSYVQFSLVVRLSVNFRGWMKRFPNYCEDDPTGIRVVNVCLNLQIRMNGVETRMRCVGQRDLRVFLQKHPGQGSYAWISSRLGLVSAKPDHCQCNDAQPCSMGESPPGFLFFILGKSKPDRAWFQGDPSEIALKSSSCCLSEGCCG